MKQCSICSLTKDLSEFYSQTQRGKTRPLAHCIECNKLKDKVPRNRWSRGRAYARRHDIEYTITPEFYEALITQPCHYCKGSLEDSCGLSLDRVDRAKGYTPENVRQCCWLCNHAKGPVFDEYEQLILSAHYEQFHERRAKLGLPPLAAPRGGKDPTVRTPKYWTDKTRDGWKAIRPNRD